MKNWGTPLASHQLQRGDVLLLRDLSEGTHRLIWFGESTLSHVRHGHATIVHAGLYDGGRSLLEASGEGKGLRSGDFTNKKTDYTFLVFRYYRDANLAHQAATWAELLISQRDDQEGGFGHYSRGGAFGSLMHRSSVKKGGTYLNGRMQKWAKNFFESPKTVGNTNLNLQLERIKDETALYCSGFVVQCYCLATPYRQTPAIDLDFRYASPKRLQSALVADGNHWRHEGYIQAGSIK